MFLNYLKIAWRNLIRQKVYTLITVVGLALAMAACILIFLFIRHEFSYDQYHEHADSIYRLNWWLTTGDQKRGYAILPSNIGPPISEVLPEVVRSVRVCEPYAGSESAIRVNSHLFEQKIVLTDPALFDMFTIRSLSGHPRQALQDPSSIVITQKVAEKYFPGINPIGKKIGVKTPFQAFVEFRVGAVIEDLPTNTHLAFDILIPFAVLPKFSQGYALTQFELVFTYLQLRPGDPPETVEHKFPEFFKTHLKHRNVEPGKYFLEPLTDLHFSPGYFGDVGDRSSPQYSYYLVLLAGFILAVAAINFVVLTTARSLSRTREVGTRKVLGAHRRQIVGQFLTETMVLGILSGVLGLFLCEVLLPSFNAFLGRRLTLNLWGDGVLFLYLLGLVGLVSLMVGTYPAFFLASFRTAAILKGTWFTRLTGSGLRKVLVVVQFGLAILFITGTLILVKQLHYIQHKDLGFDPENLVYTYVYKMTPSPEPFIQALRQNPNIVGVSLCGSTPGEKAVFQDVMPTGAGEGQALPMPIIPVGLDYFETIGMELLAGRTFSRSHPSDPDKAVVLNQS
ncbi:MAG TPA: ABC transporter permease, partial [bacterium]|nr:ABC transporter permease [bacterium]